MTNRQQSADKYFDAVMNLQGADDLKKTVQHLSKFQQNKERFSVPNVTLPNYLWVIKRGGGISTSLNAFAEYLYAAKIIEFTGIVKYFEFIPAYTKPDEYFSELTRLNNTISEIAGHYRYFRGIACIIINEWINNTNEANFSKMFDYLANHNDKIISIFCVHANNKQVVERIESTISTYMRFETVNFRFPNAEELTKFIETKYFEPCKFSITEDAKVLLKESIENIIEGKNFNGFITIKQIANDILYSLLTSNICSNKISSEMLSDFNKESAYISRIKSLPVSHNVVGFRQKEVSI